MGLMETESHLKNIQREAKGDGSVKMLKTFEYYYFPTLLLGKNYMKPPNPEITHISEFYQISELS